MSDAFEKSRMAKTIKKKYPLSIQEKYLASFVDIIANKMADNNGKLNNTD